MKYDYLIVGSGLFGSIFAYEAIRKERHVSLLIKEVMLVEIFILKK